MDAAYGSDSRLRTGITALGLTYVAGVQRTKLYSLDERLDANSVKALSWQ